jgi:hypothetical protein
MQAAQQTDEVSMCSSHRGEVTWQHLIECVGDLAAALVESGCCFSQQKL